MMENDIEGLLENLLDVELPATIADLQNPTLEYVLALIQQFLKHFHIDTDTVRRPTFDQLTVLSLNEDYDEIIVLINLSEVMGHIGRKLFFTDFSLTDLTLPVPKKTRKIAKLMSNFMLYATTILKQIAERHEHRKIMHQAALDIMEKKNAIVASKNKQSLEITEALEMKEKLLLEIERMKQTQEARKAIIEAVDARKNAAEKKKLLDEQTYGTLETKVISMRSATQELEANIVDSPEVYKSRLHEMTERRNEMNEKRDMEQEALQSKKRALTHIENIIKIVTQSHGQLAEFSQAYKNMTQNKEAAKEVENEIAEATRGILEEETMMGTQKNSQGSHAMTDEAQAQYQQNSVVLRNKNSKLLAEKKVLELKFDDTSASEREMSLKLEKLRSFIDLRTKEGKEFVTECQKMYDEEIRKEIKRRTDTDKYVEKIKIN